MTNFRGNSGVPQHVACIMDGNGRWATQRGLQRIDGHAAGEASIVRTVETALTSGVQWLTLFAFSTENWNRPEVEVDFLMEFNRGILHRHGDYFHSLNIRVRYMGLSDSRIPSDLAQKMRSIETKTEGNRKMTLTLAFNYGGRAEISEAVKNAVSSGVKPEDVNDEYFRSLTQYPDMPDVDLLVRTAGEQRVSNFMLWRLAYAELIFTDVLWPDFGPVEFEAAIQAYLNRDRRYGAISNLTE